MTRRDCKKPSYWTDNNSGIFIDSSSLLNSLSLMANFYNYSNSWDSRGIIIEELVPFRNSNFSTAFFISIEIKVPTSFYNWSFLASSYYFYNLLMDSVVSAKEIWMLSNSILSLEISIYRYYNLEFSIWV